MKNIHEKESRDLMKNLDFLKSLNMDLEPDEFDGKYHFVMIQFGLETNDWFSQLCIIKKVKACKWLE